MISALSPNGHCKISSIQLWSKDDASGAIVHIFSVILFFQVSQIVPVSGNWGKVVCHFTYQNSFTNLTIDDVDTEQEFHIFLLFCKNNLASQTKDSSFSVSFLQLLLILFIYYYFSFWRDLPVSSLCLLPQKQTQRAETKYFLDMKICPYKVWLHFIKKRLCNTLFKGSYGHWTQFRQTGDGIPRSFWKKSYVQES